MPSHDRSGRNSHASAAELKKEGPSRLSADRRFGVRRLGARQTMRPGRVNRSVTASAVGGQIRERCDEVVAAELGPQVHSHRLRRSRDVAALALAGEVVAMERGEPEPLPRRGCAAGRPALFVPAPVVGALAVDAELAAPGSPVHCHHFVHGSGGARRSWSTATWRRSGRRSSRWDRRPRPAVPRPAARVADERGGGRRDADRSHDPRRSREHEHDADVPAPGRASCFPMRHVGSRSVSAQRSEPRWPREAGSLPADLRSGVRHRLFDLHLVHLRAAMMTSSEVGTEVGTRLRGPQTT